MDFEPRGPSKRKGPLARAFPGDPCLAGPSTLLQPFLSGRGRVDVAPQMRIAHVLDQILGILAGRPGEQAHDDDHREAHRHAEHPAEIGWMSHQIDSAIGLVTPNTPRSQGWVWVM